MSFEIIATGPFEKKVKKLSKKYKSLKSDLGTVIEQLSENPQLGTPLGRQCYKVRFAIKSKNKGKSGGARIITYIRVLKETIFLLNIYDKSDKATISDKELKLLIELLADE